MPDKRLEEIRARHEETARYERRGSGTPAHRDRGYLLDYVDALHGQMDAKDARIAALEKVVEAARELREARVYKHKPSCAYTTPTAARLAIVHAMDRINIALAELDRLEGGRGGASSSPGLRQPCTGRPETGSPPSPFDEDRLAELDKEA